MSCETCDALRAELADALEALGLLTDDTTDALRLAFRLTLTEARIVGRLYAARGRAVQQWALAQDLCGPGSLGSLKVHIVRIRQKMGAETIVTVAPGYRLSPDGVARVAGAMVTAGGKDVRRMGAA